MSHIAVFDARSYDRSYLQQAAHPGQALQFHEFRLDAETAPIARGAAAVCVFVNDRVDRACLEILRRQEVRHVALRCAGFNNVDLAAAKELGITVTRVPAYSPHAVAEHTVALLLTLNRKIHRAHNRVRELNFSLAGLVGFDLHGKTAGIIGTGKIGRITAEILQGFGVSVLAYDLYPDQAWARARGIRYASLEEVLRASDILSLHTPLTPETHHLVNERTLGLMKPTVTILNTSRGKLIDTGALIQALKNHRVGGVALDVYEEEAGVFYEDLSGQVLQDDELSRLLTFPNVLITSHQAFLTHEALTQIAQVTGENLERLSAGQPFLEGTQLA
ncbi:2-hydroxyacid dehydrogenase [Opitutus sp. ER46]|uniref:2-hydroxyacid dehydrogenase n=1 Tax=Opitutus sp. ER46 TaxID=2161864 RepID=UPI000D3247D2|nr:2-hydroxyacid dehydrogenase [Opitutus sp. ER46]PTX97956.1 hydroxyacid dehydrogenase [Opitutus sp. ER46]